MKKIHINVNLIITIILVIIGLITATFVIEKVIFKVDTPNILGFRMLQVATGSMSNTLEINDLIVIKQYSSEDDVKVGDIITYKKNDSLITHRIVETCKTNTGMQYITKGDSNGSKDTEPVVYEEIYGKYVFTIPFLGKVIAFMQKPVGMTVVFVIPILLIVIELLKDKRREKLKNIRREKRLKYEYEKMLKERKNEPDEKKE